MADIVGARFFLTLLFSVDIICCCLVIYFLLRLDTAIKTQYKFLLVFFFSLLVFLSLIAMIFVLLFGYNS